MTITTEKTGYLNGRELAVLADGTRIGTIRLWRDANTGRRWARWITADQTAKGDADDREQAIAALILAAQNGDTR